jgi:hypothetical protein
MHVGIYHERVIVLALKWWMVLVYRLNLYAGSILQTLKSVGWLWRNGMGGGLL